MKLPAISAKYIVKRIIPITLGVLFLVASLGWATYLTFFANTVRYNVYAEEIPLGGLTHEEMVASITAAVQPLMERGITLTIDGKENIISAQEIDLAYNIDQSIEQAWNVGRQGDTWEQTKQRMVTVFTPTHIPLNATFNEDKLSQKIADIARDGDTPIKNIRLNIDNGVVTLLNDTQPGFVLDKQTAYKEVVNAIQDQQTATNPLSRGAVQPAITLDVAQNALKQAQNILSSPISIMIAGQRFQFTPTDIGSWIETPTEGNIMSITLNDETIQNSLKKIGGQFYVEAVAPKFSLKGDRVISFVPPRAGRAIDQEAAVKAITETLEKRKNGDLKTTPIEVAVITTRPTLTDPLAVELGITEWIGSATTTFVGSPSNRISNIKNGVRLLNGWVVKKGETFSTIGSLGPIDGSTGFLQELVIKENRTKPEYGGGLCQVSTTLFRSVMNAGLPVTARANHSYRVPYYEKDGNGVFIGPGLDATIYDPNPDFKFLNDSPSAVLIVGYTYGTKITFDLYGTKDGRKSSIAGPYTLSATAPGNPIYIETANMKPGTKKQVEKAHSGGTATATYTITYADGTTKKQVFNSKYKNWPPQFLVAPGENPNKKIDTPTDPNQPPVQGDISAQPVVAPTTTDTLFAPEVPIIPAP